jgi:hypothetical protein
VPVTLPHWNEVPTVIDDGPHTGALNDLSVGGGGVVAVTVMATVGDLRLPLVAVTLTVPAETAVPLPAAVMVAIATLSTTYVTVAVESVLPSLIFTTDPVQVNVPPIWTDDGLQDGVVTDESVGGGFVIVPLPPPHAVMAPKREDRTSEMRTVRTKATTFLRFIFLSPRLKKQAFWLKLKSADCL